MQTALLDTHLQFIIKKVDLGVSCSTAPCSVDWDGDRFAMYILEQIINSVNRCKHFHREKNVKTIRASFQKIFVILANQQPRLGNRRASSDYKDVEIKYLVVVRKITEQFKYFCSNLKSRFNFFFILSLKIKKKDMDVRELHVQSLLSKERKKIQQKLSSQGWTPQKVSPKVRR